MSARSLAGLWHDIMQNGDAFLDKEGQVQGWTLEGLVAVNVGVAIAWEQRKYARVHTKPSNDYQQQEWERPGL
jgi:hypothetical protein